MWIHPPMVPKVAQEPTFAVGDKVSYEVLSTGEPRWRNDVDGQQWGHGTAGYALAVVEAVSPMYIDTRDTISGKLWTWPNKSNVQYDPSQWSRPGYLRHAASVTKPHQHGLWPWVTDDDAEDDRSIDYCGEVASDYELDGQHDCHCSLDTIMVCGCKCGGK